MELLLNLLLCLTTCCVVSRGNEGRDLQTEIEEYLRTLTQPHNVYQGPLSQPVAESLRPYVALRSSSPHFVPSGSQTPEAYADTVASSDDGKLSQQSWPGMIPDGLRRGMARSFASSSVVVKKPQDTETAEVDAREVAYSSVRDVDTEEHLDENQEADETDERFSDVYSSEEPEEEPSSDERHTAPVPEPMARKASDMTTASQNTVTIEAEKNFSDVYFVAIVAGCSAAGIFGIISAGICFYKLQKNSKASADVDYPAYGVTGPSKESGSPNGDRKLAHSAQMYHYQHQKQQMIAVENASSTKHTSASDVDSEEENEEGDYTVYECPGLAPTGEMEVKNPLFNDDSTPMSPPVLPSKPENIQSK